MNKRLQELANQATQKFSRFGERDSWEKLFAELIVRECIEHAKEIGRLNHGHGTWHAVADRIRIKMLDEPSDDEIDNIMKLKNEV
jgi:hypothetical protein